MYLLHTHQSCHPPSLHVYSNPTCCVSVIFSECSLVSASVCFFLWACFLCGHCCVCVCVCVYVCVCVCVCVCVWCVCVCVCYHDLQRLLTWYDEVPPCRDRSPWLRGNQHWQKCSIHMEGPPLKRRTACHFDCIWLRSTNQRVLFWP